MEMQVMLIRQVEIHSNCSKETALEMIEKLSNTKTVKCRDTDNNSFSFWMRGFYNRCFYNNMGIPSMRIVGGIVERGEDLTIRFKVYPFLSFWFITAFLLFASIETARRMIIEKIVFGTDQLASVICLAHFWGITILDLIEQQDRCQIRINKAFGNEDVISSAHLIRCRVLEFVLFAMLFAFLGYFIWKYKMLN